MKTSFILGEADLSSYISPELNSFNQDTYNTIEDLVKQLGGPEGKLALTHEVYPLQLMIGSLGGMKYKQLNPEFLSMSHTMPMRYLVERGADINSLAINLDEDKIKFPRFSIYPFYDGDFFKESDGKPIGRVGQPSNLFNFTYEMSKVNFPKDIPEVLRRELEKSVGVEFGNIDYASVRMPLETKWVLEGQRAKLERQLEFYGENRFNGIIPFETKQKATEARKIFGGAQLYIIAEVEPSEWMWKVRVSNKDESFPSLMRQVIKHDPLLVGVATDNVFLIDHFDTTPFEDIARREFIK